MKCMKQITCAALIAMALSAGAFAAEKPTISILATGGTIASKGSDKLAGTEYITQSTGNLPVGIKDLVDAVPEIQNFAKISGEQVFNVGSSKLTLDNWLTLAKRVNELLAKPEIKGIVITHGTDTLEETAYFLNLVTKSKKPVVLVAAMRASNSLSADGAMNLVNAVALAASPNAADRGVMVCMNDQISSAFGVTKTHSTNVATFKCPDTGYLGYMQNNKPYFVNKVTRKHTYKAEFDIMKLNSLPKVHVHYTTLGTDGAIVNAMVKDGAKGIVNAGVGHANMCDPIRRSLEAAVKQGIPVVAATRVPTGIVTPVGLNKKSGFVSADMHSAQKARILLMLALTRTNDPEKIQKMFYEY